ncbi:magnesium transporter [Mariprofundus sp. KV]|uniref:magnesium transporter n=1 Tax=Mariprofundus sp. KV TaxID=2608715 RepID=UPI0019D57390|nr:magnesium transporter [Mariprofundus sp. KV]
MAQSDGKESWDILKTLSSAEDAEQLKAYVKSIGVSETFRAVLRLNADEREKVLTTLSAEDAADFIEEIPGQHAAEMMQQLSAGDAASILSEMDSQDQADVIGELNSFHASAVLAEMHPDAAANVQKLSSYDSESAGGLMQSEFVAYREDVTVGDVLSALGGSAKQSSALGMYIYVISRSGKLAGVVELRTLVLSSHDAPIAFISEPCLSIAADASLSDLDAFFDSHAFLAVPVVDMHNKLVGVVHRQHVAEAMADHASANYRKSQGIIGGDEIRSQPTLLRSGRRVSWLSLNIVLNIISASVIALYQDTLSAVIALAVFLPIVSDMSGCSGNQAVAVSMRELALGIIKPYELMRVWMKEVSVGCINGVILGTLLAAVAWLWQGNPYLGLVVGVALAANTIVAVSIGGTVPLMLKRMGKDPAVASGPILTTVTDMCGFFLILSLASLLLPQLTTT